ncbi:zeta toxin family protein [Lysinibacillus sphaericus]|uniref:zeta toxin family protein n=1 Tax=Lysinibacillus sphaericus TaxID=1421 RepID=UPI002DB85F48|nr:zeta toxin family protein [Lysinibacillus sphaericus]MEB7455155.1 zeta toxin family protein [Lysinibacillus sphaericus]
MNFIPTAALYQQQSEYIQERKVLHSLIIDKRTINRESKIPASAVLTAGGSGAGKSYFIEKLFLTSTDEDYVLIDADNIKLELPEYVEAVEDRNLDAADIVHEESGHIAESLLNFCISQQYSFIYDGTMSNYEKYDDLITKLKKSQFNISALYVDIDVEIALRKAMTRAAGTGRAVPDDVVIRTNVMSAKTFYRLYNRFDEAVLFNNSKQKDIKKVEPFAEKQHRQLLPHNHEEFHSFMSKVNS